jgi:hypothetical protein
MANTIPEKYQKYVITDLPRPVEIVGHHHATPCWVIPGMFPGVNLRIAGHEVSKRVGSPHADPHVHEVPEIWTAPSEAKGHLVIEAQMDGEKFLVEAPFSIFIPPGVSHCFTVVKCESPHFVMGIILFDWKAP